MPECLDDYIADFRRDNGEAIRNVCREFTLLCRKLDLFSQAIVAIDGGKFKAVNAHDRNFTRAKLEKRVQQIDQCIERYLAEMDTADRQHPDVTEMRTTRLREKIVTLKSQMTQLKEIEAQLRDSPSRQLSLTDPDARAMTTSTSRDLRKNAGLVYSVDSSFGFGKSRGLYIVEYACNPENVSRVHASIVRELEDVQKSPVTADELQRSKVMLLRRILLAEGSTGSIAQGLIGRWALDPAAGRTDDCGAAIYPPERRRCAVCVCEMGPAKGYGAGHARTVAALIAASRCRDLPASGAGSPSLRSGRNVHPPP